MTIYEPRRCTEEQYGDILALFREIHEYAKKEGSPVESADDPVTRIIGFCVEDRGRASGVHWQIPLTQLAGRRLSFPEDEDASGQLSRLLVTTAGRAELAAMLTEGTFPGA